MSLHSRIRILEKKIAVRKLDTKVHFFDSLEEFDQARENLVFGKNDVIFIDDLPEED